MVTFSWSCDKRFFVVVFFVGVDHEQVAVELVRIHLLRFFHFAGNALDLALLLFDELADLLLQLFLFAVKATVRRLVLAEVRFDELEMAPRILSQAVEFQREDDFLALDRIDIGAGNAVQALAKGFDRTAPGEAVGRRQVPYGTPCIDTRIVGQFVEDDGAHAVEALEHPRLERFVRTRFHHIRQFLSRKRKGVHAHEVRREGIGFLRSDGPQGLLVFARLDESFDDSTVFGKDDVAVFAHEFDVDLARHQTA